MEPHPTSNGQTFSDELIRPDETRLLASNGKVGNLDARYWPGVAKHQNIPSSLSLRNLAFSPLKILLFQEMNSSFVSDST